MQFREYQQKALTTLKKHNKGVCILPTGSGKTVIFMEDVKQRILNSSSPLKIIVVAPKILLASQLASEFQKHLKDISKVFYFHVHSGENGTTDVEMIRTVSKITDHIQHHQIIFTTYKSLSKVNESNIHIDVAIFDEAHHSVFEANFVGVAQTSKLAKNSYFYTATPRHTNDRKTMANSDVYGGTIISLSPKELVENGYILSPRVVSYESSENEDENILNFIDEIYETNPKILVAVPTTQRMMDLFTETELLNELYERGFQVFHITSKYGCVINQNKVSRQVFFDTLDQMGNDDDVKLIVFHHSIISEGISINGMTHALILRNLSVVDYVQTMGRILRLHRDDHERIEKGIIQRGEYEKYKKPFGIIAFPSSDKRGQKIEQKLQSIVDTLFVRGEALIA